MTRHEMLAEARSALNKPWRHQGRVKGQGLDCVGFLTEWGKACGIIDVQEAANYSRRPDGTTLRRKFREYLTPIKVSELEPTDIVLLHSGETPNHVGIIGDYPGGLSLIHAYLPARKVIEHILDASWRSRIVGAYRI